MSNNKKLVYGIAKMKFNEATVGWIEKGSFDWGGKKPESVPVEAEQVPDAPVATLLQKNGTIAPTFNLIQLDYKNLQMALGGTLEGTDAAPTGWNAPESLVDLTGKLEIDFVSGQRCTIPNGTLLANLGGKLTLTEVSKIECQIEVNKPETGGSPYSITDIPAQDKQSAPAKSSTEPSSDK